MSRFGLYEACRRCGKEFFLFKLDDSLHCRECAQILKEQMRKEEEVRIAQAKWEEEERIAQAKRKEEERIAQAKREEEDRISRAKREAEARRVDSILSCAMNFVLVKGIYQGLPAVYWYPNTRVSNVNQEELLQIAESRSFVVQPAFSEAGVLIVTKDGKYVAEITERQSILKDWIFEGLPIVCEFTSLRQGKEAISIALYRDDEKRLSSNHFEITKLISCMSEEKQEIIYDLEKGQKLFIETDDNDKPYIRDIQNNPIGNLPAKYANAYIEDEIAGVFFDHTEKIENANGEEKEIPYVKVYFF